MYTCSRFLNEKENNINKNKNTTNNNKKLNESKRLPKQFLKKAKELRWACSFLFLLIYRSHNICVVPS